MNIEQAKQIPIRDYLERLGYTPSRQSSTQLWYLSPLRNESTPSFKVNVSRNIWYDFGLGEGGDIIDLARQLEGVSTTSEVLARLRASTGDAPFPPPTKPVAAPIEPISSVEIERVGPVRSKSLNAYLISRGINPSLVKGIVLEAHYKRNQQPYFGLAFANNSGGYELRSPTFKGTLGSKDITTIPGDSNCVIVFEGFFDYLTALVTEPNSLDATVMVLNSVGLRQRARDAIKAIGPSVVELYRDRDQAGQDLAAYFREELADTKIIDKSELYPAHNDLNAWHASSARNSASR